MTSLWSPPSTAEDGTVRGQSWQWYRNAAEDTDEGDLTAGVTTE